MKIANIEMTKERFIIALCAAAAVVTIVIYAIAYKPLMNKLRVSYIECRSCENQVADARNVIEIAGKASGDRVLVAEKDTLFAMDELTKYGKAMGVNFISIKPGNIADNPSVKYKILPIDMEIEASDEQAANFIGSLDEAKKAVMKVKSFDINPDEHDRTRVRAKLTVDMYLSKREYAE